MSTGLIGFSGFVGSLLQHQTNFDDLYRSTNIQDIQGKEYDLLVCAGVSAKKWFANQDPAQDLQKIANLMKALETVHCKLFILISTVDVFQYPIEVDERTPVEETGLQAYGLHRRLLEKFVEDRFSNYLVVRLSGLVGPGLRKNVIFDLLNQNNLSAIDSRHLFQFYPMHQLWSDIQIALSAGLPLIHLTAEPLTVAQIAQDGFGQSFTNHLSASPIRYDFRSQHVSLWDSSLPYQYSARESLEAIRAYAQTEPRTWLETS